MKQKEIEILLWIQNRLRFDKMNQFWYGITKIGSIPWIWLVISSMLVMISQTRLTGLKALSALGIEIIIVHVLLKQITNRNRPFEEDTRIKPIGKIPQDRSFPSGHACLAFTCTLIYLYELSLWFSIPMLILASLISFSRIYLGVHYPSDVLCGIATAIIIDYFVLMMFN